ncbi:MAG: hypothetical protein M5U12_16705 [Verrucomicrobia bacterium]|nr:hypothetical protein [Verrucomicrobiota bacterium]
MFDAGLEAFSVADLCHPGPLAEAVISKLNLLPPAGSPTSGSNKAFA